MKQRLRAIRDFIREIGTTDISLTRGHHLRFSFAPGGERHRLTLAGSPTNSDITVRKAISDIRRHCNVMDHGKRAGIRPIPVRRRRSPAARELPTSDLSAPPQPEWRDSLPAHPLAARIMEGG